MKPQQFLRTFFPNKNNRLQYLNLMNRTSAHSKELTNVIEGYIDALEKDILDEVYDMIHENDITPISTLVFEKDLAKDDIYDWGAELTIDERDDVYYISLNPEVATVTQSGVVKMLVDNTNPAFAEILAVGRTNTERLLVFVEGLSGFRVYHNSDNDIKVAFNSNGWLVKPDGAWAELTNNTAESCPKGWIYLVFDDVSSIDILNNNLKGELKSLMVYVNCYNNQLTSLSVPNATNVNCYINQLTSLSLPNATEVYCQNNQLTSLSLPMATNVRCDNNQLTSLSLPNATEVYCYDNQLTSLSAPMATKVDCYNNQLTSLSLPNATDVSCYNNQLTSLSLPNATNVECFNNQLTATAIAALLSELKDIAKEYGYLNMSDTGNAPISQWTAQAILDKDYLINTLNWTVIYNE